VSVLTLASITALLFDGGQAALLAGVLAGLALVTKVWYVPVLVASVWYLGRAQPARLPRFLMGLALVVGVVCLLGWLLVGADFWKGLLAQDVSPLNLDWFRASITHVLDDETPLLVAALGGALLTARGRVTLPWLVVAYALSSAVVLGATIKQGTAWPVFQFAEPALALLATALIVPLLDRDWRARPRAHPRVALPIILLLLVMATWSLPAMRAAAPASDASERQLTQVITSYSPHGSTLLAPPFYLFVAGRRAFAEEADINLWDLADRSGDPARWLRAGVFLLRCASMAFQSWSQTSAWCDCAVYCHS
jgi:hypothetical protein